MIRNLLICLLGLALVMLTASPDVYAQEKLAQTGFDFLKVGQDARAAAMGDAYTTEEGFSNAIFYNPAGLGRFNNFFDASMNYFEWIADIKYMSLSAAFRPFEGKYGVIGLSVMSVDYGDLQGTMVFANIPGYIDTEVFNPRSFGIGIGYAKALTDKFVVGGQIKNVGMSLGKNLVPGEGVKSNVANTLAYDFGTIYHTGFKSLVFGMSVRNFSKEIKFEKEGFQLPLTFKIGISVNAMDFVTEGSKDHKLLVIVDAAHPRSYPEYLNMGAEYTFINTFSLRAGYVSNQTEYGATYGFGFQKFGFEFNYAYTPFGVFENVQRFSIRFSR